MTKLITISMIALLLFATAVYAVPVKTVVSKQLVESEYGWIGDKLGIGDRLYIVTYSNGVSEEVFEKTKPLMTKATITEGGTGVIWKTEGDNVPVNLQIRGLNLPTFCGSKCSGSDTTRHRYEIFDNDVYRSIGLWEFNAPIPSSLRSNPSIPVTLTIPGETAGTRDFAIKECVQTADGSRWVCGSESQSSDTQFQVVWTQSKQAGTVTSIGTAVATSTPTNPNYKPPSPPVSLEVHSDPEGADVAIRGSTIGRTPLTLTIYPDEGMKIAYFMKSGYTTTTATLSATTTNPYTIKLTSISGSGTSATAAPTSTSISSSDGSGTAASSGQTYVCADGSKVPDSKLCISSSTSIFDNPILIWGVLLVVLIGGIYLYLKPSKKGK